MSYLSKRGYVIKKESFSEDELLSLKKELRGRPLTDTKFTINSVDNSYPIYIETKNKLYIPKMYGIQKYGFPKSILENYIGKEIGQNIEYNGSLYDSQLKPVEALFNACINEGGGILESGTGTGKCFSINTPILMFNGTINMVQNIKVGDLIMGDDSTPRTVLSLATGTDDLYNIIQQNGDLYTVNKEHLLCLKVINTPLIKKFNKRFFINWFYKNKYIKKTFNTYFEAKSFLQFLKYQKIIEISVTDFIKLPHNIKKKLRGFKNSVTFSKKYIYMDPYLMGLSLNDGNIPLDYKCNSRKNRLQLLAGLIDNMAIFSNNHYQFNILNNIDIIYLTRSLGFKCITKNTGSIYISGNLNIIPTKKYKDMFSKTFYNITNNRSTRIKVKYVGKGNYYGFMTNNNERFILGDFTVTHNSRMALYIVSKLKSRTIIVVNKITLLNQWKKEIQDVLPDASIGIIQGQKNIDTIDKDITIAMLQSLSRIDYPDELFKDNQCVIFDEIHNIASTSFSKVLFKLTCKYTIGLSATPTRSDGCEYVFKWHIGEVVYKTFVERTGKPPIIKLLKINTSEYKEISSINKITGQKQIQYSSMLSDLIQMQKRNALIISIVKKCILEKRKILLLSDRRNHLVELKNLLDKDTSITFTYGLFIGSMKIENLDKSKACDLILATVAAFSEGVSEKDLDTLIITTPKKFIGHLKNSVKNESGKMNQLVGRIFRKSHIDNNPMIIDLQDNFSIYKNQSSGRNAFYKDHFKNAIVENQTINLDDFLIQDISTKCIVIKKIINKNQTQTQNNTNNLMQFCMLDD